MHRQLDGLETMKRLFVGNISPRSPAVGFVVPALSRDPGVSEIALIATPRLIPEMPGQLPSQQ